MLVYIFICIMLCMCCRDCAVVQFLTVWLSLFVMFGYWVCGESWLAIKDSLTHRPGSQGWAPSVLLSCHVMCTCVCVFCMDILGFVNMVVVVFIYFSIYLTYGWYAMNYNFMQTGEG